MERHHKRHKKALGLNLTSMIDVLTVLVFFLLVNSGDVQVPRARDVKLPESTAEDTARQTVVVMITGDEVLVGGRTVARVADVLARKDLIVPELKAALEQENDRALREDTKEAVRREVTILGDKSISYVVLKKVMATCTDADFGRVSLAVLHKDANAPAAREGA
jgi:biopolymer transport protein ExbD